MSINKEKKAKALAKKRERRCKICGKGKGNIIRKYGLNLCRQCFKEHAEELKFKKYQ